MMIKPTNILLKELTDQRILRLTLNDPKRCNALSEAMLMALGTALAEAEANPAVRVVVLAAQGTAFCAGHDLKEIQARRHDADAGEACFNALLGRCSAVMQAIVNHSKIIIAEVSRRIFVNILSQNYFFFFFFLFFVNSSNQFSLYI